MNKLILFCGLSGAGKTFNSLHLEKQLNNAKRYNPDKLRTQFNIKKFSRADTPFILKQIFDMIRSFKKMHDYFIIDANLRSIDVREMYYDLAKDLGVEVLVIHCTASEDCLIRRIKKRKEGEGLTDLNSFGIQKLAFQMPTIDAREEIIKNLIVWNSEEKRIEMIKGEGFTEEIADILLGKEGEK